MAKKKSESPEGAEQTESAKKFRVKANFTNGEKSPEGASMHQFKVGDEYAGEKAEELLAQDLIEEV